MVFRTHRKTLGRQRRMATVLLFVVSVLVGATARAQSWPAVPEVRPLVGMYVPIGEQHRLLTDALALGGQVALEVGRGAHVVAAFTWVPTTQRALADDNRIEMAQFDLGAEWLSPGRRRLQARFNPLLGAGLGLRAYRSRDANTSSQANLGAYGSLGGEVRLGRVAIRLEGRDYVTAFRGLGERESTSLRNDAAVAVGLGYHVR